MPDWKPLPIPLNQGLAQHSARNSFEGARGLLTGLNVDFGTRGALRGRPGWVRKSGFTARQLGTSGEISHVDVADLASTGYSEFRPFEVKDSFGVRPGLVCRGRIYVHDGTRWNDKGGACPMTARVVGRFVEPYVDATDAERGEQVTTALVAGHDFGHVTKGNGVNTFGVLDSSARPAGFATATLDSARGLSARCGAVSALLNHDGHTLSIILHTAGSETVTTATLYTDARTGSKGSAVVNDGANQSCICSDYDAGVFYVACWTNPDTVSGGYRVMRVSTTGTILTTADFVATDPDTMAVDPTTENSASCAIWITNSSASDDRLVVVTQVVRTLSKVLEASTLVDQAIDVRHDTEADLATPRNTGASVCAGVAQDDEVWVVVGCRKGALGLNNRIEIQKRSLSANTYRSYRIFRTGSSGRGSFLFVQHQPILLGGRVLIGFCLNKHSPVAFDDATDETMNGGSTWFVCDITDLWCDGTATGATSGNLRDPVIVARGPLDSSVPCFGPNSATVTSDGTAYRFTSIDWLVTAPAVFGAHGGAGVDSYSAGIEGTRARVVLNEISFLTPQVTHFGGATLIAGAVPKSLAGGEVHPVGFPYGDGPQVETITVGAGGSLADGDYSVQAIWSWTDDSGKVHRSAPSERHVVTVAGGGGTASLSVTVSPAHFNERETGRVRTEVYVSDVDPTASDVAHYFVDFFEYDKDDEPQSITVNSVLTTGQVLYSSGGVLTSQVPNAQGGLATVGSRCWTCDGQFLYASRLGDEAADNEAPSWHVDDTLRVRVPVTSGPVIALARLDDKLVALSETGVWVTLGEGPDDLGQGPAFREPTKVTDLGAASQRSVATTPAGVVFQASHGFADGTPEVGGLWVLDGGMTVQQMSAPVRDQIITADAGEVVYHAERDLLLWTRPATQFSNPVLVTGPLESVTDLSQYLTGDLTLVYDRRVAQWASWAVSLIDQNGDTAATSQFKYYAVVAGTFWAVAEEPAAMVEERGRDILATDCFYPMAVDLGNVAVASDPGGLGRCRSIQLIQEDPKRLGLANYNLTVAAYDGQDQIANAVHLGDDDPMISGRLSFPSSLAETFMEKQKCSAINIVLVASRASAVWTGLVLLVKGMARNKEVPRGHE